MTRPLSEQRIEYHCQNPECGVKLPRKKRWCGPGTNINYERNKMLRNRKKKVVA